MLERFIQSRTKREKLPQDNFLDEMTPARVIIAKFQEKYEPASGDEFNVSSFPAQQKLELWWTNKTITRTVCLNPRIEQLDWEYPHQLLPVIIAAHTGKRHDKTPLIPEIQQELGRLKLPFTNGQSEKFIRMLIHAINVVTT